jgi:hypothetical protein
MLCVVFVSSQRHGILLSIFYAVDGPCFLVNILCQLVIFVTPVKYFAVFLHDLQAAKYAGMG